MDITDRKEVLEGNLAAVRYRPLSRVTRIYLSAELSGSLEKKSINDHVFPHLRSHCQSLGLHFYGVDLYNFMQLSGTSPLDERQEESEWRSMDYQIYDLEQEGIFKLAISEIKLCQMESSGPAFVTLLAQKYGHSTLHSHIDQLDFELILSAIQDPSARQLVEQWYMLDTNALPPKYVLLPCKTDVNQWISIHNSLSKTIRKAAQVALGKNMSKVQHFVMSAIEEEINCGIFDLKENPNKSCFWFKRVFTDLFDQHTSDSSLSIFADMVAGKRGIEFDSEKEKYLNHLKEARLPAKYIGLDASNIFEFPLKWQKGKGLDPNENSSHLHYLENLCDKMVGTLMKSIDTVSESVQYETSNQAYLEAVHHAMYCRKKAEAFMERGNLTRPVYEYFCNSSNVPLVVHGKVGTGKTHIMASVAYKLKEMFPLQKMVLVVRFIGTTPQANNIRSTLRSICEQLSLVFEKDPFFIPGDFSSLTTYLQEVLRCGSLDRPIYIFLDGVDHLSPENEAYGMSWLPSTLSPHVKIVLSTSSEVKYCCYRVLQNLLVNHKQNMLQVPHLSKEECKGLLTHQLSLKKRTLTKDQEMAAMEVLLRYPLPLYMDFLLVEIQEWQSFYSSKTWEKAPPPSTLKDITRKFFQSLEVEYGKIIISHLVCYISSAKHGLTEMEVLDIMSSNPQVMNEVTKQWEKKATALMEDKESHSPLKSFPSLLWSQIYHKLCPFLERGVGAGGYQVLRWSHRHVAEYITARYLNSRKKVISIARTLADYFIQSPQLPEKEGQTSQPLKSIFLNVERSRYNIRKLVELPFCLSKSGRTTELKELLMDYAWLKGKLISLSCADVVEDFAAILPQVPLNRSEEDSTSLYELRLLRDALTLSSEALNTNPKHLPQQLYGRLMPFIADTSIKTPLLEKLVTSALEDIQASLLMPFKSLQHLPGSPLLVTMKGHLDAISGVAVSSVEDKATRKMTLCIVTSSWDKTLKSWDLVSTRALKTFEGHTKRVLSVSMTTDGQCAASGSADMSVRFWCVSDAKCLHIFHGHTAAVNSVLVTTDGSRIISGSSDCSIKVWNTDCTSSSCGELIYTLKTHTNVVLSMALSRNQFLASGDKYGAVLVTDIISGEILYKMKEECGSISALAMAEIKGAQYLLIGTENGRSIVRDMASGDLIQSLQSSGAEHPQVNALAASPDGKVIVSYGNKEFSVWDLLNGHFVYSLSGHHYSILAMTLADQGHLILTGCEDSSLQIWDLTSPPIPQNMHHTSTTTSVRVSHCGRYGASGGLDSKLKIYDMKTAHVVREIECRPGKAITQLAVQQDSKHILVAFCDGCIQYWNGIDQELLMTFEGNIPTASNCIDVSADGGLLMSGGEDCTVTFWSLRTGMKLKTFTNHSTAVIAVALCQDRMLSASTDGQVFIQCFHTAEITGTTSTHAAGDHLLSFAVSPNSQFFITGSQSSACHVVDIKTGLVKSSLVGHKGGVTCIQVFSNYTQCITGCEDCHLRIWDLENGHCLSVLHADSAVMSCSIRWQCDRLIYGTKSGCVSLALYITDQGAEEFLLENLLGRGSTSTTPIAECDSIRSPNGEEMDKEIRKEGSEIDRVNYTSLVSGDQDDNPSLSFSDTDENCNTTTMKRHPTDDVQVISNGGTAKIDNFHHEKTPSLPSQGKQNARSFNKELEQASEEVRQSKTDPNWKAEQKQEVVTGGVRELKVTTSSACTLL